MAFDFPNAPTMGQTYQGYTWDGEKWVGATIAPSNINPLMNGVAAPGTSVKYTREDHVHPSDISRVAKINIRVFTASGPYVPDPKMLYCIIEGVGGGGGAGGTSNGATASYCAAAGGNSGGYSRKCASAADIGASQPVGIGAGGIGGTGAANGAAGGDTSVGSLCVARGGPGGGFASGGAVGQVGPPAARGVGDFAAPGNIGQGGLLASGAQVFIPVGAGASSVFGGGAPAQFLSNGTPQNGLNASGYGSGGSGGNAPYVLNVSVKGGDGSPGVVIITEFCSQ